MSQTQVLQKLQAESKLRLFLKKKQWKKSSLTKIFPESSAYGFFLRILSEAGKYC